MKIGYKNQLKEYICKIYNALETILKNTGSGCHQASREKEKSKEKYFRRTRNLLETKASIRDLIKGINIWAVPFVRYLKPLDLGRTHTNVPVKKKIDDCLQDFFIKINLNKLHALRKER